MWLKNFQKNWKVVIAVALSATLIAAVSVQAATVTSADDTPSTLENGAAANHSLLFTTPSGVNEGKNITISFATDFDSSLITENDIDLEDDDIDLTTASDCSGSEKASIIIVADVISITVCPGDGGAIAAASEITIEIGTNATASGTGGQQIINPAAEGTYYISIAGSFGDSGSIALPIGGDDVVEITAHVSGGGSGGGNPAPDGGDDDNGCGDLVEPTINNVIVLTVETESVSIYWETNEPANSFVDYGLSDLYEIGTQTEASFVTSRSVSISGLTEGQEYHFRVQSSDVCGNTAESADYVFSIPDENAPIINNIEVVNITETSATITWETNEATTSQIEYGLSNVYGTTITNGIFETSHSIILTDLSESTTYHFQITSFDASGNSMSSSDRSFTTSADLAPANVSAFAAIASDGQNALSWILPGDTDLAGVLILSCLNDYPTSPTDPDCDRIFYNLGTSYIHSGLVNDTTYYYGAFAYDRASHFASGALTLATPQQQQEEVPPEENVCGDGICNGSENSASCLVDCPITEPENPEVPEIPETPENSENPETPTGGETGGNVCGDGICGSSESSFTCLVDCPTTEPENPETPEVPSTGAVCGNAFCDPEETNENCPSDCSAIEIPPTTVTEEEKIPLADVSFVTKKGSFELVPNTNQVVDILAGSEILVWVANEHLNKEVEKIILVIGSETYLLTEGDNAYSADVTVPDTSARYALSIIIDYQDGTNQTLSFIGNLINPGLVYEKADNQKNSLADAQVTLFIQQNNEWVVWDGSPWNQFNPLVTETNGTISWYVENGNYQIVVDKDGYQKIKSETLRVSNHIVGPQLEIKKNIEPISLTETVVLNLSEVVQNIGQTIETVRESPVVQTTSQAATPIAITTVVVSAAVLASSFNLLPFLQFFFTSPFLLFKRRKRKAYGVVYHAFTKTPIDLAIVRLYRLPENKIIASRVTDKNGRYFFTAKPGDYRLEITKSGFSFPAESMTGIKDDAVYLDVYHGEPIKVTGENIIITPNIPAEPKNSEEKQTPAKIKKIRFLRLFQKWSSVAGIVLSLYVLFVQISVVTVTLVVGQIVIYFLIRRLALPPKPKSWGIVYDQATNRPLSEVIIRVFEPKYHKLLETSLTDSKGRYTFLLGPNQYTSTFEKTGFQKAEISPIDYTKNPDIKEWAQDIKLSPKNSN
ncbi:MAG: fibronectin type III domain-containing protein [Candidatus Uhrbacteria bacterium]